MSNMRVIAILLLALPLAAFASIEAMFAPKAERWERWEAHDPESDAMIDYRAWTDFLQRNVRTDANGINRIDYGAVTGEDRTALAAFIADLAALPITRLSRPEQKVYWINLYNALTVHVVLAHYPVASIRDIDTSPGLFADGPWGKPLVEVEGIALSLNDIEHRILRPGWRDPRIHYALNCAAVGCPNLQRAAFTRTEAEAMLDRAARDYVNDPRGVMILGDKAVVSSIYVWFGQDFGGDKGVLAHIAPYAEPALAARLDGIAGIAGHRYDWSLNDAVR